MTEAERRRQLARLCDEEGYVAGGFHPFLSEASVLGAPCTSKAASHRRYREPDNLRPDGSEIAWPVPYWFVDVGCSLVLLLLAAVDAGLAAGLASFPQDRLEVPRDLLDLPAEVLPIGAVAIGHAALDLPSPSLQRHCAVGGVVHRECW